MLPAVQNMLFRVMMTKYDQQVTDLAVCVWSEIYGAFRQHKQNQRWKRPRILVDAPGQEASYVRKRKRELDEAGCKVCILTMHFFKHVSCLCCLSLCYAFVLGWLQVCAEHARQEAGGIKEDAATIAEEVWGEGHEKELASLHKQSEKFFLEAVGRDVVPEDEVDLDVLAKAAAAKRKQQKNDGNSKILARAARQSNRPIIEIEPTRVHICSASDAETPVDADFYVVDRLDSPEAPTLVAA